MPKFYFTYGTDEAMAFIGGWTEVIAPNLELACRAFNAVHPSRHPNQSPLILNCADFYTEEQFKQTEMYGPEGNFGRRCHETITLEITKTNEKE